MARVPGLSSFREDAPEGRSRNKQALGQREYQPRLPALRPNAAPIDTYLRPTPVEKDTEMLQLADALSSLNPALQRWGTMAQAEKKDSDTSRIQAKLATAGGPDEVRKLIDSDPEVASGLNKAAAMRFYGKQLAARAVQELNDGYQNSFDRQNGNVDEFTATGLKKHLDQFGGDEHFRKAFLEDVMPGVEKIKSVHAQQRSQQTYQENQQATSDVFLGTVRKGEAAGQSTDDQAKAVFAEFYGNKKLLGLPYQEQMKALSGVIGTLAQEGKYDVVKAIAELDRTTADGGHVGKLMDNQLVGKEVAQAVLQAKNLRDKQNHEGKVTERQALFDRFSQGNATPEDEKALQGMAARNDGSINESTANSWIAGNRTKRAAAAEEVRRQQEKAQLDAQLNSQESTLTNMGVEAMKSGKLFSLPQATILNKKGEEEVLTPDKFRERAASDYEQWSNQYAQQNKETWEQKTLREIPVFMQNGHIPKTWKDTFANGGAALSAAVTHGGELPEPAQKAYAMYKLFRANESSMLKDLVPRDQRDLFEAWRVGEEELHIDPRKAVIAATTMNADPTDRFNRAGSVSVQTIREAQKKDFAGASWWNLFGSDSATVGGSDIAGKIGQRAEWYAKLGVSADKAMELGAKSVKDTHINVNGWWIDASDKRLPKEFPSLAQEMLAQYAEKHGKAEGITAADLTIREAGNGYGSWRIVRKSDGVGVDDLNSSIFTAADLQTAAARRKELEDQRILEEQRKNATAKPAPTPIKDGVSKAYNDSVGSPEEIIDGIETGRNKIVGKDSILGRKIKQNQRERIRERDTKK